jgi:four helix bundle protein
MNYQLPMSNEHRKIDIQERCLKFAARTALFVDNLPQKQSAREYGKQLIRASASVGSNMEEADGALSKKDFVNKVGIARKESRESRYWLKLIKQVSLVSGEPSEKELEWLLNESDELRLILSSIIKNSRN